MTTKLRTVQLGINEIAVLEDQNGEYRSCSRDTTNDIQTIELKETPLDTIRSLRAMVAPKVGDLTCLTPDALIILTFLEITWRNEYLEKEVQRITQGMAKFVESKAPNKGAEFVNNLLSGWKEILNRRKKWLYIGQVYDTAFMPALKAGEVTRIPLIDSFMIKNILDFVAYKHSAVHAIANKNKTAEFNHKNKLKEAINLVSKSAYDFLQENKLYWFLRGNHKTAFNVLRPASDLKPNEIRVPKTSGFEIGDKGAGLRHPVMTGVHIMTVVGCSNDHTLQVSEKLFQKFQADADGDFFMLSEIIYKLMK